MFVCFRVTPDYWKVKTMLITNDFVHVLTDCNLKYKHKMPEYGDSWKKMPLEHLYNRLDEEFFEFSNSKPSEEYGELIDIINIALMLATRIKQSDGTQNGS